MSSLDLDRTNSVAFLAWDEVQRRLRDGAAAIMPVGAAAKQHGWHMPMGTDQVQAEWFSARLAERVDALIWPTLTYGYYPAFVAYCGSVSVPARTFELLVGDVIRALRASTPNPIFVLDTGISTIAPIDRAIAESRASGVQHLCVYTGDIYRKAAERLREQPHGSHADEMETSVMLALAPALVNFSRGQASPREFDGSAPGLMTPDDPNSATYSASGSFGDPTYASREKGQVLVDAILQDLMLAVGVQ